MENRINIIETALQEGRTTLSEHESKQILSAYQIPVTREIVVYDFQDLINAAEKLGYPLVLKGCSSAITHKTEKGLIRLDIRNDKEAEVAFEEIARDLKGRTGAILVQEMIKGKRELAVGLTRDPQFGPCVMFGLGGIFAEIIKDVSFRIAPLEKCDAFEMVQEIKGYKILQDFRGMAAVDLDMLTDILIAVGRIGLENERIKEIDINPVMIFGNKPIAVDALVVLD